MRLPRKKKKLYKKISMFTYYGKDKYSNRYYWWKIINKIVNRVFNKFNYISPIKYLT